MPSTSRKVSLVQLWEGDLHAASPAPGVGTQPVCYLRGPGLSRWTTASASLLWFHRRDQHTREPCVPRSPHLHYMANQPYPAYLIRQTALFCEAATTVQRDQDTHVSSGPTTADRTRAPDPPHAAAGTAGEGAQLPAGLPARPEDAGQARPRPCSRRPQGWPHAESGVPGPARGATAAAKAKLSGRSGARGLRPFLPGKVAAPLLRRLWIRRAATAGSLSAAPTAAPTKR